MIVSFVFIEKKHYCKYLFPTQSKQSFVIKSQSIIKTVNTIFQNDDNHCNYHDIFNN